MEKRNGECFGLLWFERIWDSRACRCRGLFPKSIACPWHLFFFSAGEGGCDGDKVSPVCCVLAWETLSKQVLAGQGGSQEVARPLGRAVMGDSGCCCPWAVGGSSTSSSTSLCPSAMSPDHPLLTRTGATSKLTWPPALTPSVSCNTLSLPVNTGSG